MKFKSILSGVFAFAIASGTVLAFNEELRIPNGAYMQGSLCTPIDAAGCNTPVTEEECTVNINGVDEQLYENTGDLENATCENKLFRISQ